MVETINDKIKQQALDWHEHIMKMLNERRSRRLKTYRPQTAEKEKNPEEPGNKM